MEQKIRRLFVPWKYEAELETVNARSAEGFHLIRAGRFSRTEEADPGVRYRYALDCREGQGFTELTIAPKPGANPMDGRGPYGLLLLQRKLLLTGAHQPLQPHQRRSGGGRLLLRKLL